MLDPAASVTKQQRKKRHSLYSGVMGVGACLIADLNQIFLIENSSISFFMCMCMFM